MNRKAQVRILAEHIAEAAGETLIRPPYLPESYVMIRYDKMIQALDDAMRLIRKDEYEESLEPVTPVDVSPYL